MYEVYKVVSYDASTGEWVIVHLDNVQHTRVEIRAVFDSYRWGKHEPVTGPNNCAIRVGQEFVPNRFKFNTNDFVDVNLTTDTLYITEGAGDDIVHQRFNVRSAKVIDSPAQ